VTEKFAVNNPELKNKLRDDSLSEVSLEGKVIQNLSFSQILADNNMTSHMLGSTGFTYNLDPIHINQITPAHEDGPHWQRNDLLISARHTSTIYLYRPSTGKIIWYQQGPWLNQHSAHFVNQHTIAVYGNNVYGNKLIRPFAYKNENNEVYLHDFKKSTTSRIHSIIMYILKPATVSQGRVRVLPDNSVFVEETDNARLFKLNGSGQLIWSYINNYDDANLGIVSWSRYLTAKEIDATINIGKLNCDKD
jgi:outer membrane protein assembly factor BamB